MQQPVLELEGFSKTYASPENTVRINADCLCLHPGEMLGIIGASGCGKSTVLESLALLSRPDACSRLVIRSGSGREQDAAALWTRGDLDGLSAIRRTDLGFVHQGGNLYPFLNVRDNILLPYLLRFGRDGREEARLRELAGFLGIAPLLRRYPASLSYGERQRVAIARALMHRPSLVLADEPTSALDPQTAHTVMHMFAEAASQAGAALVVVSHDHALLERVHIPMLAMSRQNNAWTLPSHGTPCHNMTGQKTLIAIETEKSPHATLLVCIMSLHDFLYERLLSFCGVLSFAAALTPILLLVGLRFGIVQTLSTRLLDNPNTLNIQPYGNSSFSPDVLQRLAEHPSVSFLVPTTRMLATSVGVANGQGKNIPVDMIPTAPGDPLLEHFGITPPEKGIVITRQLARRLHGFHEGDSLALSINRQEGGRIARVQSSFPVCGILPDAADWKEHVYAPLPFVEAVERYRDGYAVPSLGWPGKEEQTIKRYAGFRMVVKTLDDVVVMRDELMKMGIEAYTSAREVENVQALRKALLLGTIIIGGATGLGLLLSLIGFAVASVQRKEHFLAQARLMGFPSASILAFPVVQLGLCALCAATLSTVFYALAATAFDTACASYLNSGESICRILPGHVLALYAGALTVSLFCCVNAGFRLTRLQPAEVLRRHV